MNYRQLVQSEKIENIRIVFCSKEYNQLGVGIKYCKADKGYARSFFPLKSNTGKLVDDCINVTPILNTVDIPQKLYPVLGNAFSLIDRWEQGIYPDLSLVPSSLNVIKIFEV